ncbi:hypothetical protein LPB03_05970 [Polaribacter vadi]|uniref:Lipid/polyisoprenoid-binding YceI-like domain-containing protein n=1 Tax=Polaribacter vadi TaxID=1774273 RepID=A0A1B8TWE3_9FLAO|nr:hypothetical protein [Polaribacter vadi]AOW17038.1 hypothetical protein LPB03_05970 [Polaribacter vadi]OBY64051.1 hypothetical protein LPB3_06520 [Polaribacter vadi]
MKKLLILCFVLAINLTFAQENSATFLTVLHKESKNALLITNNNDKMIGFQEIVPVDFETKKIIDEAKFSLNDFNDKSLNALLLELDKKNKIEFFIVEKISTDINKTSTKKSFIITTNKDFIDQLITAKIVQEGLLNESVNYGDRDIEIFKNYSESKDILNVTYKITSSTQLQIGNNIIPFIKKPFKTEIDKTLVNSLNLLAINF